MQEQAFEFTDREWIVLELRKANLSTTEIATAFQGVAHQSIQETLSRLRRRGVEVPQWANTRVTKVCTFPGCLLTHEAKGYCGTHYNQFKRGIPLRPIGVRTKTRKKRLCSLCSLKHYSKGYCRGHYLQMRAGKTLTSLSSFRARKRGSCFLYPCTNIHYSRGLCKSHYEHVRLKKMSLLPLFFDQLPPKYRPTSIS